MKAFNNFQNYSTDLIVVIRTAGERTLDACKALLWDQVQERCVHVISELPFEAALRRTYEIGIESGVKWLMTLDADVFLKKDSVSRLLSQAESLPRNYFQIEGLVYDKLTGMFRKAGHRMYRTSYLKIALKNLTPLNTEIRPEYATLQRMEAKGYPSKESSTVFGIHDYEQYYRDIYRKAFVHANKHQVWLPQLISRWKKLTTFDDDYQIALRGLYDGLLCSKKVRIDARDYIEDAEKAMKELGLTEKPFFSAKDIGFDRIEEIIAGVGDPPVQSNNSFEAKFQRLKYRYTHFGKVWIAPYLFGSMLYDIGFKIKQLVENRKPS